MLEIDFMEELFRNQAMYPIKSVRKIFEKLAHSSIMKLNAPSMNKLFDLMLMGFKYQVSQTVQAEEIKAITMKHLLTMQSMVGQGSTAEERVLMAIKKFTD